MSLIQFSPGKWPLLVKFEVDIPETHDEGQSQDAVIEASEWPPAEWIGSVFPVDDSAAAIDQWIEYEINSLDPKPKFLALPTFPQILENLGTDSIHNANILVSRLVHVDWKRYPLKSSSERYTADHALHELLRVRNWIAAGPAVDVDDTPHREGKWKLPVRHSTATVAESRLRKAQGNLLDGTATAEDVAILDAVVSEFIRKR